MLSSYNVSWARLNICKLHVSFLYIDDMFYAISQTLCHCIDRTHGFVSAYIITVNILARSNIRLWYSVPMIYTLKSFYS